MKKYFGENYRDKISVIIPVFKTFSLSRILMAIDSLRQQKKVNLEIVVAEQSPQPTFPEEKGISYIHLPSNNETSSGHAIPGLVRNEAAKISSGKYLYNADGDIVFLNPYFFAESLELLKTGKDIALYRPPMRRLPIEDFPVFEKDWKSLGIEKALGKLDMSQKYAAHVPGSNVQIISFRKKESGRIKTFLYTSSDLKEYEENPNLKGEEPRYSTLDVHAGATFMERRHFIEVGGFCERFTAWGCHDADLQWKLRGNLNLLGFPQEEEYAVLHLDHERGYFDKEAWQRNREIQQLRREGGARRAISEDLKNVL